MQITIIVLFFCLCRFLFVLLFLDILFFVIVARILILKRKKSFSTYIEQFYETLFWKKMRKIHLLH